MVEHLNGEIVVDVDRDLEVPPVAVPLRAAAGRVVGVDPDRVGQVHAVGSGLEVRLG